MTIAQLVEKLKQYDSQMTVELECPSCDRLAPVEQVDSKGQRFNSVILS